MYDMQIVIIGGAAGSKIAQDIFLLQKVHIRGFMNNYVPKPLRKHLFAPVLGDYREESNLDILLEPDVNYFVGTGDNFIRNEIVDDLIDLTGKRPINAIHPSSTDLISKTAKIGWGNLIMPLVVISPYARIGNGTILNTGCVIGHDNIIKHYAQIAPGVNLGGYVMVKKYTTIGVGASVMPHLTIGEGSLIAGGSSVIKDVEPYTMVAGVPAVKKRNLR